MQDLNKVLDSTVVIVILLTQRFILRYFAHKWLIISVGVFHTVAAILSDKHPG